MNITNVTVTKVAEESTENADYQFFATVLFLQHTLLK